MANDNVIEVVVQAVDNMTAVLSKMSADVASLSQKTAQAMDKAGQSASFFDDALDGIKERFLELATVATVIEAFKKFAEGMSEAQDATLRLDLNFRKFGSSIGETRQDLTDWAEQMSKTTSISLTQAKTIETQLLLFPTLTGDLYKQARQIAADFVAGGQDAASTAFMLGRAIESPQAAMRLLRQEGIALSKVEQDQITLIGEYGDKNVAAAFLLGKFEEKSRDTQKTLDEGLGNSIKGVKNAFDELFEGAPDADNNALVTALHELKKVLQDPETKRAADEGAAALAKIAEQFITIASKAVSAGAAVSDFLSKFDDTAKEKTNSFLQGVADQLNRIKVGSVGLGDPLQKVLDLANGKNNGPYPADLLNAQPNYWSALLGSPLGKVNTGPNPEQLAAAAETARRASPEYGNEVADEYKNYLNLQEEARQSIESLQEQAQKSFDQIAGFLDTPVHKLEEFQNLLNGLVAVGAMKPEEASAQYEEAWTLTLGKLQQEATKFYSELDKSTQTTAERAKKQFEDTKNSLIDLESSGQITDATARDRLAEAQSHLDEALNNTRHFSRQITTELQDGFVQAFIAAGEHAQSFGATMLSVLRRILLQAIAMDLMKLLGLDKIQQMLASGTSTSGSYTGAVISIIGKFFGFAGGTDYSPGGFATVGENGPEKLFLPRGSKVVNQNQAAFRGGSGDVNYAPNTDITINGAGGDLEALQARMYAVIYQNNKAQQRELTRLLKRNGYGDLR